MVQLDRNTQSDTDELGKRRAIAERRFRLAIHQLGVRLSLGILIVTSAVVIVSRSINTSNSLTSVGFAVCQDVPCFRGLTPGKTSWSEAHLLYDDTIVVFDPLREQIAVSASHNGVSLGNIYINLPSNRGATIGEIVGMYGNPCKLTIVPKYQSLTMYYPRLHLTSAFVDGQLHPETPVRNIVLSDPAVPSSACEYDTDAINRLGESIIYRHWQGFVSFRHYFNSAANP